MKKKIVVFLVLVVIAVAAILVILSAPKWSERSFDASVQEVVTMPDGETRIIVERSDNHALNSLGIGENTELLTAEGETAKISDFQKGTSVHVTLKDSFVEETPFYYPTVYELCIK